MNVLLFCETKSLHFQHCFHSLKSNLDHSRYAIKQITSSQLQQHPWEESTLLLVFPESSKSLSEESATRVKDFLFAGNKVLAFGGGCSLVTNFVELSCSESKGKQLKKIKTTKSMGVEKEVELFVDDGYSFDEKNVTSLARFSEENKSAIVKCVVGKGVAVLCGVSLDFDPDICITKEMDDSMKKMVQKLKENNSERVEILRAVLKGMGLELEKSAIPELSNLYLIAENGANPVDLLKDKGVLDKNGFYDDQIGGTSMQFVLYKDSKTQKLKKPTDNFVNVICCNTNDTSDVTFNAKLYFKHLKVGSKFSRMLMFGDIVTSTQIILNQSFGLSSELPDGFVFAASRQTKGRGRGDNVWISSEGSLLFSILFRHYDTKSLPLIQHLASLAVVEAVKTKRGYENIDIHIKWPNDIYCGKTTKIGGILVNVNFGRPHLLIVGIGLNVANQYPSACINDMIRKYNTENNTDLELFSKEELMARIMNKFEEFYSAFLAYGFSGYLQRLYYSHWIHSGQEVFIAEHNAKVRIEGVNESGYLITKDVITGTTYILEPDGNSFDLMKNLISKKVNK